MILVDTAPLIALIDKGQGEAHRQCVEAYRNIEEPMLTTWCCFTEAMYFLYQLRGWKAQDILWQFIAQKSLHLHVSRSSEQLRMRELMEQYQDLPMDLADASLVVTAETLGIRRIFTLDSDFYVYRLKGREAFIIFPYSS